MSVPCSSSQFRHISEVVESLPSSSPQFQFSIPVPSSCCSSSSQFLFPVPPSQFQLPVAGPVPVPGFGSQFRAPSSRFSTSSQFKLSVLRAVFVVWIPLSSSQFGFQVRDPGSSLVLFATRSSFQFPIQFQSAVPSSQFQFPVPVHVPITSPGPELLI